MVNICKDFDGFDVKYDLTMVFIREAKEEEDFESFCTMNLKKVNEEKTLVLKKGPKKKIPSIPQTASND